MIYFKLKKNLIVYELTQRGEMKHFIYFLLILFCISLSMGAQKTSKQKVIVLLGVPGSGKGTYAEHLSQEHHLPKISTGDLFRKNIEEKTLVGEKAQSYIDSGSLVPDDIVIEILKTRLEEKDCTSGYILDGFPRTLPQAQVFEKMRKKQTQMLVLNLEIPDSVIIQRLVHRIVCIKCGKPYHKINYPPKKEGVCDVCRGTLVKRSDDHEKTIKKRLAIYHEITEPVKKFYQEKGYLIFIDGNQPKDKTLNEIEVSLEIAMH